MNRRSFLVAAIGVFVAKKPVHNDAVEYSVPSNTYVSPAVDLNFTGVDSPLFSIPDGAYPISMTEEDMEGVVTLQQSIEVIRDVLSGDRA